MYSHSHARRPYEPRTRTFYRPKPPTQRTPKLPSFVYGFGWFFGGCFLTSLNLGCQFRIFQKNHVIFTKSRWNFPNFYDFRPKSMYMHVWVHTHRFWTKFIKVAKILPRCVKISWIFPKIQKSARSMREVKKHPPSRRTRNSNFTNFHIGKVHFSFFLIFYHFCLCFLSFVFFPKILSQGILNRRRGRGVRVV